MLKTLIVPLILFVLIIFMVTFTKLDIIENIHTQLIFAPSKDFLSSPANEGILHEEIYINTEDGEKLHGYLLPAKEKTNYSVIYLHGNADNVSSWYQACTELQKQVPVNFLIVDYRGYGKSTGTPTREGVIKDALAMYKYLTSKGFKSAEISVYGRSIGGAIGLELATREKIKSIVVQSSFTSLKDVAKDIYPMLPSIIVRNDLLNSKELIKKIKIPILISHGSNDEIVPVNHSFKLYELANEPKKLIILKGATHNDISQYFTEEYLHTLRELFTK